MWENITKEEMRQKLSEVQIFLEKNPFAAVINVKDVENSLATLFEKFDKFQEQRVAALPPTTGLDIAVRHIDRRFPDSELRQDLLEKHELLIEDMEV